VWLYHCFPLSLREVEEMMLQRGIVVSRETIRQWCQKFGQTYANGLRRRRHRPRDKWHLDEVFIKIRGKTRYLWRAVDQDGNVLDILITSRRDTKAATRFFRKLLTEQYVPRALITDKTGQLPGGATHRVGLGRASPVEVPQQPSGELPPTHTPTRTGHETVHLPGHAQRFLSAFSGIYPHFRTRRHLLHAQEHRREMANRFSTWNEVTGLITTA
jgi:putative transposase